MFLTPLSLLFNFLLLFQLLSHACLSQCLPFTPLVGLGIQCSLQSGISAHTSHNILPQLREYRRIEL